MNVEEIVKKLRSLKDPRNIQGMKRFGITPNTELLGISLYVLRPYSQNLKKQVKDRHRLALDLWKTGIHEARLLAVFLDEAEKVTEKQMEDWVKGFDSWDICDQATCSLFDQTPYAYNKALEWSRKTKELEKRAGFALMAGLAVHDKKADDKKFLPFLKAIKKESIDDRSYVRKAVNWALRNIGKSRNKNLYKLALETAFEIKKIDSKPSRWIASDAIRELKSEKIKNRFFTTKLKNKN